jgi:hypothetical protein
MPAIQHPAKLAWEPDGSGNPEGICRLNDGLLMLYDVGGNPKRIDGKSLSR